MVLENVNKYKKMGWLLKNLMYHTEQTEYMWYT